MFTVKNMSSHSKSKCSEARVTWLCHIGTVVGKVKKPKLIQIRMKQILGQFILTPLHIIIWGNTKCTCTFASYIYMHKYMCLFWNPFIYIYIPLFCVFQWILHFSKWSTSWWSKTRSIEISVSLFYWGDTCSTCW